jgi:hypothetical protein
MGNPTNLEPCRYEPRTGQDVWAFPLPLGYLDSIQSAGSVAAPLLAGASFTLVALVLQSAIPFGRWQDLALLLLVAAGLAQVFAVQSVIWTRRYMVTPDELRQWFPDDFTEDGERPTPWILNVQEDSGQQARTWANRTRWWINVGISLLLAGVAVGVVPPGRISVMRWAVVTAAWAGVAVEATWVAGLLVAGGTRRAMLPRSAAIITSGGATAAAGFAATTGTADGAPATWWAIALAVAAAPCWLAALTGARLSHGHIRLYSPLTGWRAGTQAALALLAPAIFVLALWSAIRQVAADRHERLSDLHPGVEELLPRAVSIRAHHRAWNRCTALPVTNRDELARLLDESGALLGQDGQPRLDDLWARVEQSPGCVVRVVDRGDDKIQFGYYIVYPLLAETVHRALSGQIKTGRQLKAADLAASPDTGAGSYISVIWAPGRKWTRRCVIATLADALAASCAGNPSQPVFARPATPQGEALMASYGFKAIGKQTGVWALQKSASPSPRPITTSPIQIPVQSAITRTRSVPRWHRRR